MILGRFPFMPVVRLSEAQLGKSEAAPSEAAAKPVILIKSLLVLLFIIAPFDIDYFYPPTQPGIPRLSKNGAWP
jgi:hypothetical protein